MSDSANRDVVRSDEGFCLGAGCHWAHECEVCVGIAVVGDKAKLGLDVSYTPRFQILRDDAARANTSLTKSHNYD